MTGPDGIRQLTRKPLYHEAVEELRAAILRGAFRPGERLREQELARLLGLSRGPVREAIRQLEQEGIVAAEPHVGVSVVAFAAEEIRDAFAIREFIEISSAEAMVNCLSVEERSRLFELVELMQRAAAERNHTRVADLDVEFHRLLLRPASAVAQRVWSSLEGPIRIYLSRSDEIFLREVGDVGESHRPILEALVGNDPERLRAALSAHTEESRALVPLVADGGAAGAEAARAEERASEG
jgi:DNA-binding GntR family transcriptional regulator